MRLCTLSFSVEPSLRGSIVTYMPEDHLRETACARQVATYDQLRNLLAVVLPITGFSGRRAISRCGPLIADSVPFG
jgi:hypothetical protein